jgi:hypothetical protein
MSLGVFITHFSRRTQDEFKPLISATDLAGSLEGFEVWALNAECFECLAHGVYHGQPMGER